MTMTSLEEFRQLASRGNLIPVVAEIIGDVETPVGAFQKIGRDGWSFLFESAERNEESGRFSLIGINPLLIVSQRERDLAIRDKSGAVTNLGTSDPLSELQQVLGEFRFVPREDIPHFQGGAVGFAGYDVVRFFKAKVPIHPRDDLELPEMIFMVAGTLIVFDHRFRLMRIIASADLRQQSVEDAYAGANKQIETLLEKLGGSSRLQPIAAPAAGGATSTEFKSNTSDFEEMVLRAKEYISEGDIFKVVLSQRFESEFSADPLDLYRCLRFGNPSPYMFLLNFGDEFCALGSSPELHVRVRGRTAELRPIAGTRPRGTDPRSDEANARELLADPKERAEHVMLIDLARNDLGRIAKIGSVRVTEQMTIERY